MTTPLTLTDSPAFAPTNSVEVPRNSDPALADRFYTGANVGLQALTNRTQWLLQAIHGPSATGTGTPDANSGVMRIRSVADLTALAAIADAQEKDLCLVDTGSGGALLYVYIVGSLPSSDGTRFVISTTTIPSSGYWLRIDYSSVSEAFQLATGRSPGLAASQNINGVTRLHTFRSIADMTAFAASNWDIAVVSPLVDAQRVVAGIFIYLMDSEEPADDVEVYNGAAGSTGFGRWFALWHGARGVVKSFLTSTAMSAFHANEGDIAVLHRQPDNIDGLFVYKGFSELSIDSVNVFAGIGGPDSVGRWVAVWNRARGVNYGLATLDSGGKLEQNILASRITGVIPTTNLPGITAHAWGTILHNGGGIYSPPAWTGSVNWSAAYNSSNNKILDVTFTGGFSPPSTYSIHLTAMTRPLTFCVVSRDTSGFSFTARDPGTSGSLGEINFNSPGPGTDAAIDFAIFY